ncbi:Hypothetical predicted protein [Olea europaea subsp. europaea]|uniref:Uncharacterized protein n=1 Tax=Olea europaea subsp. europaea TaxID=158383 RepID=A0A8S0UHN1_OLEEU|nr:Hypothetical predicted protein [Olea europaea subsp. europaea]
MNSETSEQTCPMCSGPIESEHHNCLKSIRNMMNSMNQALNTISEELKDEGPRIHHEILDLRSRMIQLEDQSRLTITKTNTLQAQIDDLKEIVDRFNKLDLNKSATPSPNKNRSQRSTKSMELGEDESSSASSSELISQLEANYVPAPVERARQMAARLGEVLAQKQQQQASCSSVTRTFERLDGPRITLNSIGYTLPTRQRYKITAKRPGVSPHPEASTSKEEPPKDERPKPEEFVLTSNNCHTQGRAPGDQVEIIVEARGRPTSAFRLSKDTPGSELHKLVRSRLAIPEKLPISIMYAQHTIIPPDDRSLWNLGFRHIPNHIAVVPDLINRGDQVKLAYKGKGPNVNGGHIRKTGPKP